MVAFGKIKTEKSDSDPLVTQKTKSLTINCPYFEMVKIFTWPQNAVSGYYKNTPVFHLYLNHDLHSGWINFDPAIFKFFFT